MRVQYMNLVVQRARIHEDGRSERHEKLRHGGANKEKAARTSDTAARQQASEDEEPS
jgi:hypothetical protein